MDFDSGAKERSVPRNIDAERSVLGMMLLDQHAIEDVQQILQADDFYLPKHRTVFQAILETYDRRSNVDQLMVEETLSRMGALEEIGGQGELLDLVSGTVTSVSAAFHAEIVREKAVQRRVLEVCRDIAEQAFENSADARELVDEAERRIFEISRFDRESESRRIDDILQETFERIDYFRSRKGEPTGIVTGYYDLDEMTGGLQPGELLILAARPSMGKTSFALNLAERIAAHNQAVAIFSLEMSAQQVISNMLCCRSQVNGTAVRKGRLTEEEYRRLQEEAAALYEAPIFVDDAAGLSVSALRGKARRLHRKSNIQMIIIDYLQLMTSGRREESRQQEISYISRSLKGLARELKVPVIALSQLNRDVENREDHRPRMSDLRESGAIEQDADVIMLLHREEYFKPTEHNAGLAQLILAKQRNGPTGEIELRFFRDYMRFENFQRRPEPIA
jgi:replicative DNA helicase